MFPYADDNPNPGRKGEIKGLILVYAVVLLLWSDERAFRSLGFIPALVLSDPFGSWYRWFTSEFLHGGIDHFIGNVWALWIFGDQVAARLRRWFLPFYVVGGLAANLLYWTLDPRSRLPSIGASGAICAVIGAYLVLFPRARMRCYGYGTVRYTVSAVVFGVIYILGQFIDLLRSAHGAGDGVAHGAHLGGLAFGMAVAVLLRANPEPTLGLSGATGDRPETSADEKSILAALDAGDDEIAVHRYIEVIRRDPYFELPESHQLAMGDRLTDCGYPQLGRSALERFLQRHPESPSKPYALVLLGYVLQSWFKEFAAAAEAYEEALRHPAATDQVRADAEARLRDVRTILDKTLVDPPSEKGRYWILLESAAPLAAETRRLIAEAAGHEALGRLQVQPGVVMTGADQRSVAVAAQLLDASGIPVVVFPEERLLRLPKPEGCDTLTSDLSGMTLGRPGSPEQIIAWKDCLLLAVVGIPGTGYVRKGPGIFDVEVMTSAMSDPPVEYGDKLAIIPTLQIIRREPLGRHVWVAPEDRDRPGERHEQFYRTVSDILINAVNVPVNAGAQAAFDGRLPDACRFDDPGRANAYLYWQLQLARLKREKSYA
jgi:membrane associated rhomboid family serine protease